MSRELIDCPFCGYELDLEYKGESVKPDPYEESWDCSCCHCGASPLSDLVDRETAIKVCNTRATPPANSIEQVTTEEQLAEFISEYMGGDYSDLAKAVYATYIYPIQGNKGGADSE